MVSKSLGRGIIFLAWFLPLAGFIAPFIYYCVKSANHQDTLIKYKPEPTIKCRPAPGLPPPECRFPTPRDVCYSPICLPNDEKACVGIDKMDRDGKYKHVHTEHCGNVTADDINNIKIATREVVKAQGWLTTRESGNWVDGFMLRTTAFASHNTTPFDEFLDDYIRQFQYPVRQFYWSRGHHAMVSVYNKKCLAGVLGERY